MPSRRVEHTGLSPTFGVVAQAEALRAAGIDVIDFSVGQPDFPTIDEAKRAGQAAIAENRTGYTLNAGLLELRQAIAERIERERGLSYDARDVLVSPGAKASLYFAFLALVDPGDDVLVPAPYWTSYPEQIRLADGRPVFVACAEERGFKLDARDLDAARTARTRCLVLNYPANPTGACYGRDELEPIAAWCVRHDVWVVADEIYARLLYDGRRFTSIAALSPEIRARTVVVDGMSKTFAMTGWRIGYAAGPRDVIAGMAAIQSHATSNAPTISQWASIAALRASDVELDRRRDEFECRRDAIVAGLARLPGVRCAVPEGAFYAFANVAGLLGRTPRIQTPTDLAGYLLEDARVAVVPGEAFGSAEHVRFSYALPLERIRDGLDRVRRALDALG
jgi:aspartate aminotransferase